MRQGIRIFEKQGNNEERKADIMLGKLIDRHIKKILIVLLIICAALFVYIVTACSKDAKKENNKTIQSQTIKQTKNQNTKKNKKAKAKNKADSGKTKDTNKKKGNKKNTAKKKKKPTDIKKEQVYKLKTGTAVPAAKLTSDKKAEKYFRSFEVKTGTDLYNRILNKSYKPGGGMPLADLRYLKVLYYDFNGTVRVGEIMVNKSIADRTRRVFYELYKNKYPIRKMRLIDDYYGQAKQGFDAGNAADWYSMEDDNTSGFNYRTIQGSTQLSNHAGGRAIDLNPLENPQTTNGRAIDHEQSCQKYADSRTGEHAITRNSIAYRVFTNHGFSWGGNWSNTSDYQHFEIS